MDIEETRWLGAWHVRSSLPTFWMYSPRYVKVEVSQLCPTLQPQGLHLPRSSVRGILQARILEWVAILFSRGAFQPREWIQVSHTPSRFLSSEPPGKPKNTGVGSLSLLSGIFLTQELNWGLLHCRGILYQVRHLTIQLGSLYLWNGVNNRVGCRRFYLEMLSLV